MISTATAAVNAAPRSPRRRATDERRRARSRSRPARRRPRRGRRAAGPAPSPTAPRSTSRAICASAVSAPTLVARTTRRPVVLIVAPATSEPGADLDRHRLAGQHRLVDRRRALDDDAVGRDLLARPDDEQVADRELARRGRAPPRRRGARVPPSRPSSSRARIASPERPFARRLEAAAEQDQRRDHGGDLEVGVGVDAARRGRPSTSPGGERAERDQRVHRRGAVAGVRERARWNRARRRRRPASRARARPTPSRRSGAAAPSRAQRAGPSGATARASRVRTRPGRVRRSAPGRAAARRGSRSPRRSRSARRPPRTPVEATPRGRSVAKLTVASTPSSLLSFRSIRAAQEAQVMPSRSSRSLRLRGWRNGPSGCLVSRFLDRRAERRVVEVLARGRSTRFVSRSTSTESTPGTADTSSSTAATQCTQCIPGTRYRIVLRSVFMMQQYP